MGNVAHWGALLAAMGIAGSAGAQECRASSGPQRAALVELYTSEGCSSCPPADRQLSRLGAAAGSFAIGKDLVALAWHVDFWDYIGWKDPFARAEFTARQRALVAANGSRTLYTPHFFVGGREVRDRSRVDTAIRSHSAQRAAADVRIAATFPGDSRSPQLALRIEGVRSGGADAPAVLHVAVTESGLENRIAAGENRGATLKHDHVVRHWLGPVALDAGTATLVRTLALTPEQARKGVAVVAFVQDTRSGEVLQAATTGACKV